MGKSHPPSRGTEISQRLTAVLSKHTLEEVVQLLGRVGYVTSIETVRRYREGLAKRIDSAFLAAVVKAFGVDAAWLLSGAGFPEDIVREFGWRANTVLREVALTAAVGFLGPRSSVAWQEESRRDTIREFLGELIHRLVLSADEAAEVLRHTGRSLALDEGLLRMLDTMNAEREAELASSHESQAGDTPPVDDVFPKLFWCSAGARRYFIDRIARFRAEQWPPDRIQRVGEEMLAELRGADRIVRKRGAKTGLTEDEEIFVLQQVAIQEAERGPQGQHLDDDTALGLGKPIEIIEIEIDPSDAPQPYEGESTQPAAPTRSENSPEKKTS